jgi:hypothetical protein
MKISVVLLFYIFFSLTTLTLSAQSTITEVVSEKSQGVSEKLGVSKKSGDSTCIRVSQNSDSLQQGQEVVITVKDCQNLEMLKVLVSGITAEINDKGVAKLSRTSGMIGTHNIPVSIVYRDKDGNQKTESYTVTYKVRKAPSQ